MSSGGNHNVPYQKYIDAGYFEVIQETVQKGKIQENKLTTLVTPKGVDYIAGLLAKDGQRQLFLVN